MLRGANSTTANVCYKQKNVHKTQMYTRTLCCSDNVLFKAKRYEPACGSRFRLRLHFSSSRWSRRSCRPATLTGTRCSTVPYTRQRPPLPLVHSVTCGARWHEPLAAAVCRSSVSLTADTGSPTGGERSLSQAAGHCSWLQNRKGQEYTLQPLRHIWYMGALSYLALRLRHCLTHFLASGWSAPPAAVKRDHCQMCGKLRTLCSLCCLRCTVRGRHLKCTAGESSDVRASGVLHNSMVVPQLTSAEQVFSAARMKK